MNDLLLRVYIAAEQGYTGLRSRVRRAESGQSTVEWAIIVAFVAIMAIIGLKVLQGAVNSTLNHATTCLNNASTPVSATPVATAGPGC